jgi:hypothetical protein
MPRQAHLIGSVGLPDAETVFTTVSEILGSCCPRIPDGETGDRGYWIRWQRDTFASHLSFDEAITTTSLPGFKDAVVRTFFKLRKGVNLVKLELGELGYAREAEASYKIFARLIEERRITADVKFQVSLPTPAALLCGFIVESDRKKVERAVERAMLSELDLIQRSIPADRLCIQWDVCYEIVGAEGKMQLPYADAVAGSIERIARLCRKVNPKAELGIHLCYGDPGHKHIVEPKDLTISVAFANGICRASPRSVDFVHMPVPRGRADESFFAPLATLALPASTRLVLGLIHYTDGVEGARKRIAVAERYVRHFDIATECGFGRRDPVTIPDLLRIHKAFCGDE